MTPFLPEKTIFKYVIRATQLQEDGAGIGCEEKQVSGIMEYCKSQNAFVKYKKSKKNNLTQRRKVRMPVFGTILTLFLK